jgi:hypothetical protein
MQFSSQPHIPFPPPILEVSLAVSAPSPLLTTVVPVGKFAIPFIENRVFFVSCQLLPVINVDHLIQNTNLKKGPSFLHAFVADSHVLSRF